MTHGHSANGETSKPIVICVGVLVVLYGVACGIGWPQQGTELARIAHERTNHAHEPVPAPTDDGQTTQALLATTEAELHPASPHFIWVAPFVVLLLCIAVLPLLPATELWWASNLHRFYIAGSLGVVTLVYYLVWHDGPVEAHWPIKSVVAPIAGQTLHWNLTWTVLTNAILHEYVPFIILLFSLYTICGGIRIEGNLAAHPLTNTGFIAVGGLLASFIGTTGAAMLLIRPLVETNKERRQNVHTVVFFIFVVCNCGGCLLPIGDPPLFLGYLRGVDFLWTLSLWKPWLLVNVSLLAIYWSWDHFISYPREERKDVRRDETTAGHLRIRGWLLNGPLLIGIVLCVALLDPLKVFPGTSWHAPMFLREVMQLGLVGVSLLLGSVTIRRQNHFTYHAILEVAVLFGGIFVCMQPALQILNENGQQMGIATESQFYWSTGGLSSVLDNAPTYVVFFETARTLNDGGQDLPVTVIKPSLLMAISLGAVFMGAMTYIGNGPNFMVKAIAETAGIRMPSFFGYLKYSFCILLPVLALTAYIFFH